MSDRPPARIDVRGPRFAASITAVLLLIAVLLGLTGRGANPDQVYGWFSYQPLAAQEAFTSPPLGAVLTSRIADAGFILLAVIAALFLWGVVSPRTAPWGLLYRKLVQPRLKPATDFEDPRPPRFAQGVGLFVTAIGLGLYLAGVPWALPIAAAAAFVAAFLNAVFGLCLGCQLYLLLARAGIIRTARPV